MALLSADQIFGVDDRLTEDVRVPEWGGTVRLRGLSGAERDEFESSITKVVKGKEVQDTRNIRARLIALSAIKEDGTPLFAQNQVAALGRRSSIALSRLFDVACRLSGISSEDAEALEGNSDGGPSEPPTSDSPSPTASQSMSSSPAPVPAASANTWPTNDSTGHSAPNASTISPR